MVILKIVLIVTLLNCNIVLSTYKNAKYSGNRIIKVSKHVFEKKCIVPKYVKSIEHFYDPQKKQYDIYYIELLYKIISMHLKFKFGDELEKRLRKSDYLENMYIQLRKINECIQINF